MNGTSDRLSQPAGAQPFSRPLVVDDVPEDGLEQTIEADGAECEAVAAEIGIPAVLKLEAHYKLAWRPGRRVHVEGTVEARITQDCVVSLEPFDSDLTQAVDVTFAPAPQPDRPLGPRATASRRHRPPQTQAPAPVRVIQGEEDLPDPIIDGRIDLGAVAVEFLTLALDFYPRKPDAQFADVVAETDEDKPSAFAALARLKDNS